MGSSALISCWTVSRPSPHGAISASGSARKRDATKKESASMHKLGEDVAARSMDLLDHMAPSIGQQSL
jgi:hypothetical protein